jgi:uracil-DNA glycosylase family 4
MIASLAALNRELVACRRCPRLVRYLAKTRREHPEFYCKPVPGRGDPRARVVVVGLAPGRRGSNRTGLMFSGDAAGRWVNRAEALLPSAYITAAARCAPPGNKPAPRELDNCRGYLARELELIAPRVVVALGHVAHDAVLKILERKRSAHPFRHGAVHRLEKFILLDSYHPSRQNTQTGVLTRRMFHAIFRRAATLSSRTV